ncbi:UDP-glucose 4-epimerase [Hordeum vulgare]|nr:UDP-glucose 4-epimerase [Hordeum vulgare]
MLQLLEKGYAITAVDNFHNSVLEALDRVHHIVGPTLSARLIRVLLPEFSMNFTTEMAISCYLNFPKCLLKAYNPSFMYDAVIHFAGLKAVAESVAAEHLR